MADNRDWPKIWFDQLARFHRVAQADDWEFTREDVIAFLQGQKKRGATAWKRMKIVEALIGYQHRRGRKAHTPLEDIRVTLLGVARREQPNSAEWGCDAIEESPGLIDPLEPEAIQALRRAMRAQHLAIGSERAYVSRVQAFMRCHRLGSITSFERITTRDVERYLSSLAIDQNLAESSQDQAFFALLFLFRFVLKRDLQEINVIRSKKPQRIPTVMSREEVARALERFGGVYSMMAQILYGSGLRLSECLQLRIKDIKTTMIYLHVLNRRDVTVTSPLDRLVVSGRGDGAAAASESMPSLEPTEAVSGSDVIMDFDRPPRLNGADLADAVTRPPWRRAAAAVAGFFARKRSGCASGGLGDSRG